MSGTKTEFSYRENAIPEDSTQSKLDIINCRLERLESLAGSATAWRTFTYIMAGLLVFTVVGSVASCAHVRKQSTTCVDSVKTVTIGDHGHYSDDASCETSLQKGTVTYEGQTLVLNCQCR